MPGSITFRLVQHSVLPGVDIVEILLDGQVCAAIYPLTRDRDNTPGVAGIRVISAFIREAELDESSIPAVMVMFKPGPYPVVEEPDGK